MYRKGVYFRPLFMMIDETGACFLPCNSIYKY